MSNTHAQGTPTAIKVTAKFTQNFIDKYKYEDAKWFWFAVNVNGYYYNVFRNERGWVSNSKKHGLSGMVPAFNFKSGYSWIIPLNTKIKVANKKTYGFHYTTLALPKDQLNLTDYTFRLSSVKENVKVADLFIELVY